MPAQQRHDAGVGVPSRDEDGAVLPVDLDRDAVGGVLRPGPDDPRTPRRAQVAQADEADAADGVALDGVRAEPLGKDRVQRRRVDAVVDEDAAVDDAPERR